MLYTLQGVLNPEKIRKVRSAIEGGEFENGSTHLNEYVKTIKNNEELLLDNAQNKILSDTVLGSLYRHPNFVKMAYPRTIAQPLYARYTSGMKFGEHVDAAIMGVFPNQYRSDISCTIFLNDPDEYEGGELIIETGFGSKEIKLSAGDVILYPSTSLHRVANVTRGVRIVAVTWITSLVPDAEKRAILYQFEQSVDALNKRLPGERESLDLTKVLTNLKRRWCIG